LILNIAPETNEEHRYDKICMFLQGTSSLTKIWLNDFWGTPMNCSTSHKSYRPITICLFR